jgi:hypothetical protein
MYLHSHMARIHIYTLTWRGYISTLSYGEDLLHSHIARIYIYTLSHGEYL